MAMAKGAFRLNTFMVGKGYNSDFTMGKYKTNFVKDNIRVHRRPNGYGNTYLDVIVNNRLLKRFDITGGPQKAENVEKFKKLIIELG